MNWNPLYRAPKGNAIPLNYCKPSTLLLSMFSGLLYAGSPVWTFSPLTATTMSVSTADTATIQYQVTNQSRKTHTLEMRGITGISQNTSPGHCANPFTLSYQQSCTLSLTVDGSAIPGGVVGGPVVCQQGNALQCYQPSRPDSLNITSIIVSDPTTLITSVSDLVLSRTGYTEYGLLGNPSSGVPRIITVTNTGSNTARNFSINYPIWPSGTTANSTCGASLAAGSSCTITITPGNTATSDGSNPCTTGVAPPIPQTISIRADNATTASSSVLILGYGCIYQSGYVYALDDTNAIASSVGGKIAGLTNVSNSNQWTSTSVDITGAESITNGAQNTTDIIANASCTGNPANSIFCAAYQCRNNFSGGGYTDWYLPAICEEGYDRNSSSGSGCGTSGSPTLQNMQSNLVDNGNVGSLTDRYWSSTEISFNPINLVWYQNFLSGGLSGQDAAMKNDDMNIRCSRALTF